MQLATLLSPQAIRIVAKMSSKKRLFHELGEIAASVHGMEPGRVVERLIERENLGPTGVGQGVALPHARLNEIDRVRGIFVRIERPMEFGAVDRRPVDLVFALFAPESSGVEHLKALAVVSRTLRDPDLCAKLRANSEPATLHAMLTEGPATAAA